MSGEWNAEKMAYGNCEVCHGTGYYNEYVEAPDSLFEVDVPCDCGICLKRRITELEAALRPFARYWTDPIDNENWIQPTIEALEEAARVLAKIEGEAKPERPIAPPPQPTTPAISRRKGK